MLTAEVIIKILVGIAVLLGLFFSLGWLSLKIRLENHFHNLFEKIFWCLFVGLLQAVSVYAIIKTGLQTILLPVPFFLLFFIATSNPRVYKDPVPLRPGVVALFLIASITVFLVYYLQAFISWDTASVRFASGDHSFYARVAEYLNSIGKENSTLEYIYTDRFKVTPYHYGDIWFCALAAWLTQLKTGFALLLIVYPLLAFIFTVGLAGFLLRKFPEAKSGFLVFACIPALFLSGFSSFFPAFLLKADVFNLAAAAYPKTLWIACFLIASFILVNARNFERLYILVAVAGLTFINIFPTLFGAVILLSILAGILKLIRWNDILLGFLTVVVALIYMALFYKILAAGGAAVESSHSLETLTTLKNIRTSINIFVGGSFQLFVLIPFLILFAAAAVVFYRERRSFLNDLVQPDVLWSVVLVVAGLSCWAALFAFTTEAVQFFHNIFIPLAAIILAALVFWILTHSRHNWLKVAAIGLLFLSVSKSLFFDFHIGSISKKEWLSLQQFLKGSGRSVFATYKDPGEFSTLFLKNTRFAHAVPALHYLYTPYVNESLNTPFLQVDTASPYKGVEASLISMSSFDYYTKIHKDEQPLTAERQMEAFIKQERVDYVFVSQNAVTPSFVPSIATDSLILPLEGWRLYKVTSRKNKEAGTTRIAGTAL